MHLVTCPSVPCSPGCTPLFRSVIPKKQCSLPHSPVLNWRCLTFPSAILSHRYPWPLLNPEDTSVITLHVWAAVSLCLVFTLSLSHLLPLQAIFLLSSLQSAHLFSSVFREGSTLVISSSSFLLSKHTQPHVLPSYLWAELILQPSLALLPGSRSGSDCLPPTYFSWTVSGDLQTHQVQETELTIDSLILKPLLLPQTLLY